MSESHPVLPGAEAWTAPGRGDRARTGIGVIHGFTGNPVSMRPLAEALAGRDFAIDMPRLPGHGTHYLDMVPTRYEDWLGEVLRTIDRLSARCDRVVLVGLSMGGTLVFDAACRRQDAVAGVMGINSAILRPMRGQVTLTPLLSKVVPVVPAKVVGLAENDIAKGGDEKAYPKVPLQAALSLLLASDPLEKRLPDLRIPAVVAYSRHDHSVPNESSKKILALIGSSDKRELVLERSYHVATLDYDFDILVDAAADLADRVGGTAGAAA